VNANKTPDRPARAERIRARSAINLRPEDGYLQLVVVVQHNNCGLECEGSEDIASERSESHH